VRAAPRVSVVVPFLNAERFLGEAIESVLAQTHDDWELLLIDDGATDGGAEIALAYAARDPGRISYVARDAGRVAGPAAARNLGLAHAQGEYVAFLDADDVWMPRKLEEQTAILDAHYEAGMLYGLSQWWYSWTGESGDSNRDFVHELGVPATTLLHPPSLIGPFFVRQTAAIPNPASILVRRSVFEQVGGFETAVPDVYEDQTFYAKVCLHAPVIAAAAVWDRYRQHAASNTAGVKSQGEEGAVRARFLTWLIEYLSEQGFRDAQVIAALRRQRFRYAHPSLDRIARSIGRIA
jgi:glycosyltransferase involved in cell wall biosynthesis